ncbi:MAG: ABC transporter permease [Spirochaetes bacterium]|nr:ABC transporter permease [Spirochaetota bacterium]
MPFSIRRHILIAFLKKEFRQLMRDKKMRFVIFAPPIIMIIVFGYAINMDVKEVPMVVLDNDNTAQSRSFVEGFTASGYFMVHNAVQSHAQIDSLLDRGEAELAVVIEKNFGKHIKSGKQAALQTIVDGTDSNRAGIIMAYVNQIALSFSKQYYIKNIMARLAQKEMVSPVRVQQIELEERTLFNQELSSRNFFLPGILVLLLGLVTVLLTAMSVVKEREVGTIEQIIVSPVYPSEYIAGKMLPFVFVAVVDIFIISAIIRFWFAVPFNGNYLFLMLGGLAFIFSSSSMGLFISTISKTQQQAMLSTFLFVLPAILFSGFIFPIYSMPEIVQYFTYVNPFRYFVEIVRGVFLKGVGLEILWVKVAMLLGIGIIFLFLSVRRFARGIE